MKREILYVDDEMENLVVFQATFEDYFDVVTAASGAEALELLAERSFPVVIADQRMPKMSGAGLFAVMRKQYPHTKRIMLTGYADPKAMLSAINEGQVYYFIKKPWEQEVVFSTLVRAIEAYDMSISNVVLQDRLVAADRCAMLGRSAARLAHEMGNQLCMLPLLELIEEEYSDQEDLVRMAGFARSTHERLVEIINEVKSFVRFQREATITQPLALADAVHELVEFLRYERNLPLDHLAVDDRRRAGRAGQQREAATGGHQPAQERRVRHPRPRRRTDFAVAIQRPERSRAHRVRQRLRHRAGSGSAHVGAVLHDQG